MYVLRVGCMRVCEDDGWYGMVWYASGWLFRCIHLHLHRPSAVLPWFSHPTHPCHHPLHLARIVCIDQVMT